MLRRAESAIALWQLDSVTHYAGLALTRITPLTEDSGLMRDPKVRRSLLGYQARSLELLGRATRDIEDLSALEQALAIYEDLGDVRNQARTHHHFSERLSTMGEPLEAIGHLRMAIELMERIGDTATAAAWLNTLGVRYRVMGQPSTALEYHLQVLPTFEA
ncbi:MAG: hypothetical protein KDC02_05745, partial [Flavobacteriales bacterium]|nr:hypothetical protein [Flavobacteriales bacterium]